MKQVYQIFYSATKSANLMLLETLRQALTAPNTLWLLKSLTLK